MKDIKIVIGSNFGDEGKGMMTDFFSQKPNSIIVCSNGGAQRGHTVVTPDGIRHVFHHFGSGAFNGASTYLPEDFILNPVVFRQELHELYRLKHLPATYIHNDCMVTTPWDMMANQIVEESRGKNKHGSCGMGIFETITRYKAGVVDLDSSIRDYYLERFSEENIQLSDSWKTLIMNDDIFDHFLDDLDFMNEYCSVISDDYFLNLFDNIVFEAGQGLLLDQNNLEYFPNLTPSNTGIKNPKKIIERVEWNDEIEIETCYVTRTYMTRHGVGKFPTECNKSVINGKMFDKTNVPNIHQNSLRYGTLDYEELCSRCSNDVKDFGDKKSIAITHCNEFPYDSNKISEIFKGWDIYYSNGEIRDSINRKCDSL